MILVLALAAATLPAASTLLKPGDPAPAFSLKDGEGKTHTLAGYKGQVVALYFYPKDDTPGCTAQACNLRDNWARLKERGVVVLGVSFDGAASHKAFAAKYNLPFPLLSDTGKSLASACGIGGTPYARRVTFLVGPDGRVLDVIDPVTPSDHAAQILAALDKAGR
ncbi:MAG: peroxiredoxin [Acidobacteria bacterium]|nr:peroxiredoxin [Acidobacteriota bacterium]